MTDDEKQFRIVDRGNEIGILNTKNNQIAIFHGYRSPLELKRRLEWAEDGLNNGTITTRDWVWEDYTP